MQNDNDDNLCSCFRGETKFYSHGRSLPGTFDHSSTCCAGTEDTFRPVRLGLRETKVVSYL